MNIRLYDKVMLKDGHTASIVEIFDDGKAFLADIDLSDSEWETIEIAKNDIAKIIG